MESSERSALESQNEIMEGNRIEMATIFDNVCRVHWCVLNAMFLRRGLCHLPLSGHVIFMALFTIKVWLLIRGC